MVVLLVLVTVLCFVTVELLLVRRKRRRAAVPSIRPEPAALLSSLAAEGPPGGLFLHRGHTWAKVDPSGAVRVGLDAFARGVLGSVDRFELPAMGARLRRGEPGLAALQAGKRIDFVSPVGGVVCAVNPVIHTDPEGTEKDPYDKGWAFAVRPSDLARDLKKLRIGAEAARWLDREVRRFAEFLTLHRVAHQEIGVTLPDGGVHADGILETMDGEILQIVIRKFFR
jgi:glycine cleavage system H protein